jgi:hypothetical protein
LHQSDELRALMDALCEESISEQQMKRLEELVLEYPEAEAYYVQTMNLHAGLVRHFGHFPAAIQQSLVYRASADRSQAQADHSCAQSESLWRFGLRNGRRLFWGPLGFTTAAAALLLAVALWPKPPVVEMPVLQPLERTDDSVAVLLQAPGAEWEETASAGVVGGPLSAGWLRLKSGFAHIEFYSGATVVLQGPAEFQLISRMEAYCTRGKLRANVPPEAKGFSIASPQLHLVDLGTEFGFDVAEGVTTEVHVFEGKVELYDSAGQTTARKELTTGQGIRLDQSGTLSPIPSDPSAFATIQDLVGRAEELARRRQQEWLAASEPMREDPSLLVYYPFQNEHPGGRKLLDHAQGRLDSRDGTIVGCAWTMGRWPGKQGLEFKGVSDRVRLRPQGEFDTLSLMAWVRVDALPNCFNSLFMTDNWEDGEPHWHISSDGVIELGVQGRNRKGGVHYYSPVIFTPDRFGQWTHLAVVYDRSGGRVTHFVNGRQVAQEAIKLDIALSMSPGEIGNWNTRRSNHPIRFLSGCMDEFMVFSRALTDQEVERIYTHGRPALLTDLPWFGATHGAERGAQRSTSSFASMLRGVFVFSFSGFR